MKLQITHAIGKTLENSASPIQIQKFLVPTELNEAVRDADTYVSFTMPAAEVINIPIVANLGKRIILGTTGFTPEQNRQVVTAMSGKVPAVFSPNYSVGVNILFKIAEALKAFPAGIRFQHKRNPSYRQKGCAKRNSKETGRNRR